MNHLVLLTGCTAGFAALALATERQQEALFDRVLPTAAVRALDVAGWLLLLICLWLAVHQWGWGFGLVAYSGHTSLAAGVVYLGLLIGAQRMTTAQRRRNQRGSSDGL